MLGVSTTMAFTRLLRSLARDEHVGSRVVPIIPDEARTFGMDSLFREIGIYAAQGQKYEPVDHDLLLSYSESTKDQILEEGITEAGSMASFIAAGTAYSTRGVPMLPFYTFYSMFGFQRIGDMIWQAADMRARGFMMAATAGRTTLLGEGLQHQDGHSHLMAATVPNCRAYDPAFAGELAVILDHGMRQMLERQEDVFYYLTLMNEGYAQPDLPEGVEDDILKGMYRFAAHEPKKARGRVRLLGSGAILPEVIAAAQMLCEDWNVAAEVWSVTSFTELSRDASEVERWNRLHPSSTPRVSHVAQSLSPGAPVIAATDYVRALSQLIATDIRDEYTVLGTDGFGRSDTRAALRRFFEIDRQHVVVAALSALVRSGELPAKLCEDAIRQYGIDADATSSWTC